MFLQVKFEKMPRFCDHCGLMGHVVLECGTGEFTDDQLQYGAWMLASMELWHPETPRVRGGFTREGEGASDSRGRSDRGGRTAGRTAGRYAGGGRGRYGGARGHGREGVWMEKEASQNNFVVSRKRTSGDADLEDAKGNELTDTASSPLKPVEEEVDKGAKPKAQKLLLLEDASN